MASGDRAVTDRAAVVVVNYRSSRLLERNLAQLPVEVAVVVVDNYSDDAERTRVRALGAQRGWQVLTPGTNLGFGDGVNLGVARALGDNATTVCVVNPDAVLSLHELEGLVAAARERPRAFVAPRIVDSAGKVTFSGSEVDLAAGRTRRADIAVARHPWLSGACLAFTAGAWQLSGGFANVYFLYWEDVDISWAMLENGGELWIADEVTVVHDAGGTQTSTSSSGKSATYVYYNCRNRLVFAARRLGSEDRRRWIRGSVAYAREVLLRGGSRRVLLSPRYLWAAVSGTLAGLWTVCSTTQRRG